MRPLCASPTTSQSEAFVCKQMSTRGTDVEHQRLISLKQVEKRRGAYVMLPARSVCGERCSGGYPLPTTGGKSKLSKRSKRFIRNRLFQGPVMAVQLHFRQAPQDRGHLGLSEQSMSSTSRKRLHSVSYVANRVGRSISKIISSHRAWSIERVIPNYMYQRRHLPPTLRRVIRLWHTHPQCFVSTSLT